MTSIWAPVVVFGIIFVCLATIMLCSWKAMDALNRDARDRRDGDRR